MQIKEGRRKEKPTNSKRQPQDGTVRRSSLSTTKMFSQLSMSFYDQSTIRKNKQIIMDNCALETKDKELPSQPTNKSKGKLVKSSSKRRKKPLQGVFLHHEKDQIDFRTTQQSKMLTRDEEERGNRHQKSHVDKSSHKQKGGSIQKFRKLLLADIIQSRIKTPKMVNKRQPLQHKKH